jgi:adhesin transport system membrane fusion protein
VSANMPEKKSLRQAVAAYFGSHDEMGDEPLPEVNKALIEDAPRVVRLTIWGLIAFVVFCLLWANFAVVDEVTRGDGKAIPSSRLQKIQNLEGGIVAELYVKVKISKEFNMNK